MGYARDFGAAGDGRTDDTEALQHALDESGLLELGRGTFRITRPLVLDLKQHGPGGVRGKLGSSRIVMAGAGPALQVAGDHRGTAQPSSVKSHTWESERFPTLSGFEILGEHPAAVGIQLRRTMQATLTALSVRNCRIAVHLVERNRNFVLSDSHLYDNREFGLFFDQCNLHQAVIHGNHISYNRRAGIMSTGGDVHNVQITGNDIEYNNDPSRRDEPTDEPRAAEIWLQAGKGTVSEFTIASNTIQATIEPGGANLRIEGSEQGSPRGARLIAVTGNVLGSQMRGLDIQHAQRVTITGNTIYDSRELSLAMRHCSGVSVSGNTLVWRGVDDDPPSDGVWLEDCENVVLSSLATQRLCSGTPERGGGITLIRCRDSAVQGSQVIDPLVRGVELEDCQRCRVSGNTIVDRRSTPSMIQAIRVTGRSRNNLIDANLIGGAKQSLLDVPEEAATLQGNVEIG